ncbi:MAG: site-2 protease family protein [Lewinella sp.]
MTWTFRIGRIAGIDLKLHWTFLILLGWVFLSYFRQTGELTDGLTGVGFILALFGCVVLHELGHALAARRYGVSTRNIVLLPIGGVANLERLPENPREELIVAAAGPAVNVVIAILLGIIVSVTGGLPDQEALQAITVPTGRNFLIGLLSVNILLVLFNLIPAFPMDGGRMLRAVLSMKFDRAKATNIAAKLGQALAIVFVFLGFFGNFWLVFIGLFIYLGAGGENRTVGMQALLEGYHVEDAVMHQYTALNVHQTLDYAVSVLLDGQERDFVVLEDGEPAGILTRDDLIRGLKEHGRDGRIGQVARRPDLLELSADSELQKAYQQLRGSATPICFVRDAMGRISGVLNLENIEEVLLLRRALGNRKFPV